jgi:DNA repair protein RecO (recombination protein O)
MRIEQQPGYVLHARPYRETSLLLECLTREHGRIGVVARGVRRERSRLQRAQLEPFQRLQLDLLQRGELATLLAVEASGPVQRLTGDAGLAGLYMNELVVRLTGRQDPQAELFDAYARTLQRLARDEPLAWTLRRFERDLLQAIGYALQLDSEAEGGASVLAEAHYHYQAEHGPQFAATARAGTVPGRALLALARDEMPDAACLQALRGMMRGLIRFHLGGGELRAWQVLSAAMSRR